MSGRIELYIGDITDSEADAIVNAANTDLVLGSGVAGAIRRRGGRAIQDACDLLAPIPLGESVRTTGGDLPHAHVIHAAVMDWGGAATESAIRDGTRSALRVAAENGVRSIAFPALGTGVGGFALRACAEIMLAEAQRFLEPASGSVERILFHLFGEQPYRIFESVLDSIRIQRMADRLP
ncbi:MAG: macro domain-containing protein [Myxococcota bacterium]